ncbi:MAG: DEAD/DEAH box helicase [Chlorobi bacterium]|nr:DEAD/DEAH box helicase [Chlorobiota bacterium]
MEFKELPLTSSLQEGVESFGFSELTPIQEACIPLIMKGKDIIGCAQTGTGKTMAYAIPTLQRILTTGEKEGPYALVLAPTRELALQIEQQFEGLTYFLDVNSSAVYGGGDATEFERQKKAIIKGADILIATPGRLLAHIKLGYVSFNHLTTVILDEADRMLDMGFREDIMHILKHTPSRKQTLLFSATMSPEIRKLAHTIMNKPEHVEFAVSKPAEGVMQAVYMTPESKKMKVIQSLLSGKDLERVLIFSATKKSVKEMEQAFRQMNLDARAMHSDLDQHNRNEIMRDFRNKKIPILIATDIVSRGIDIDNIELVINYNVPRDPEDYVHRVGRTARAKSSGVAITLVDRNEVKYLTKIEKLIGYSVYRMPEISSF